MTPLQGILVLGGALFSIGLYGVLARRNAAFVLMSVQLMLNGVNLNLMGFVRFVTGGDAVGQALVLCVIAIAAAQTALAVAVFARLFRIWGTANLDRIDALRFLQTGSVSHYALAFAVSVIALAIVAMTW